MDDFDFESFLMSLGEDIVPPLDANYDYNTSQNISTYLYNNSEHVFRRLFNFESLTLSSNAQIALILVYGFATFLSLVGNACVVIVLTFGSQKWTELNIFLVNLAIADLTMALFCIPFTFTEVMLQDWLFGETMCPLVRFTQVLSVSVSIYILLAIGIDRYYAVVHPLKIRVTRSRAKMVVVVIWIVSTALASVQLVVSRSYPFFWDGLVYARCDELWPSNKWHLVYTVSILGVTYVIPLILLCGAYIGIGLKMWGRRAPGNSNRRWDQQHERAKKKTVKMLCIVVLMFAICWLPIHLITLIVDFKADLFVGNNDMALVLFFCAHWLAMSNSFMNPIVYSFMNDKFRSDLMRLFGCPPKKKEAGLTRDKQTTINISERNGLRYTLSRSSAVGSGFGRSVAIQTMNGCRLHRPEDLELRTCAGGAILAAPTPSSDHSTTSEAGERNVGIGRTSSWPPPDLKDISERRTPRVRARLAYFYLKQKVTKKNPKKRNTYKDTPPRVLYKVQQDDRLNNTTAIEQTVSSV